MANELFVTFLGIHFNRISNYKLGEVKQVHSVILL